MHLLLDRYIKIIIMISFCILSIEHCLFAQEKETADWEKPQVLGINKEDPHCFYIPYKDINSALNNDPNESPFYKSLNGIWKFNWVKKPSDRPVDFYRGLILF